MSEFDIKEFLNKYDKNKNFSSLFSLEEGKDPSLSQSDKFYLLGCFDNMLDLLKSIAINKIGKEEKEKLIYIGTLHIGSFDIWGILNNDIFVGHFKDLINFEFLEYIFENKSLNFALDFIKEIDLTEILDIGEESRLLKIAQTKLQTKLNGTIPEFKNKNFHEEPSDSCGHIIKQKFSRVVFTKKDSKKIGAPNV